MNPMSFREKRDAAIRLVKMRDARIAELEAEAERHGDLLNAEIGRREEADARVETLGAALREVEGWWKREDDLLDTLRKFHDDPGAFEEVKADLTTHRTVAWWAVQSSVRAALVPAKPCHICNNDPDKRQFCSRCGPAKPTGEAGEKCPDCNGSGRTHTKSKHLTANDDQPCPCTKGEVRGATIRLAAVIHDAWLRCPRPTWRHFAAVATALLVGGMIYGAIRGGDDAISTGYEAPAVPTVQEAGEQDPDRRLRQDGGALLRGAWLGGIRQAPQGGRLNVERTPSPMAFFPARPSHYPPELVAAVCRADFSWNCASALRVSWCEMEGYWNPQAIGAEGERGIFQLHPLHERRFPDYIEGSMIPERNAEMAYDLYLEFGWQPFTCAARLGIR